MRKAAARQAEDARSSAAIWAGLMRRARAWTPPEFDQSAYDLAEHGGTWPPHVPQDAVLDLAEVYAGEYSRLDDAAFHAEGVRLAELIAGPAGAVLCDADRGGASAGAIDVLARAIGLGACVPEGIKLWGIHVTYT